MALELMGAGGVLELPVGYIFEWDATGLTGAPDLTTADKVAEYFGYGIWEAYGAGRVTVGAADEYKVGSEGGETEHVLIEAELPVIDGQWRCPVVWEHKINGVSGHAYGLSSTINMSTAGGSSSPTYGYGYKFGSGKSHNNMQPYKVVYRWRRIA